MAWGVMVSDFALESLSAVAILLVFCVGVGLLAAAIFFVLDLTQTHSALRRNYPLIGRFRYLFEHLGTFFRQYFYAADREEMPFNREQRSWIYRAAKDLDNTASFGSTQDIHKPGTILFANSAFPVLDRDALPVTSLTIGPDTDAPYLPGSIFNVSGMSFGAISKVAVEALSRGARLANCWINTGEGGLSAYHLEGGCDIVFQIGTAKYGVRDAVGQLSDARLRELAGMPQIRMFELKLSQGAKAGKGGILPAGKVTPEIAAIRGILPGVASISPNRHEEISTPGELLDLVGHIRAVTGKPVGIKAAFGEFGWLDSLFEEVNRRGVAAAPDFITVDGGEGGSGAAPVSLMDFVGLPLGDALPVVVDRLIAADLRDRIRVIASGKLVNPGDVAWALCAGADFIVSARGFMFALGCIQAMRCAENTCPTGITTHNPRLQKGLDPADKSVRVQHYVENLLHEVEMIAHSCGAREPRELTRAHALMVAEDGVPVPLEHFYTRLAPAGGARRLTVAAQ